MDEPKKIIELTMASDPALLAMMRCVVKHSSEKAGCNTEMAKNMVIAVNEACMNIIQHAYGNDYSQSLSISIFEDRNKIVFRLVDHGKAIDFKKIERRNLDEVRPGGLGLPMIETIMDKVEFSRTPDGKTNVLEMVKITH